MSSEAARLTAESRTLHLENMEQHIFNGEELAEEAILDLRQHPEAFSGLVRILGYKVFAYAQGISIDGSEIPSGLTDRYAAAVDMTLECLPEDSSDTSMLVSMKRWAIN